jgi:hypothetical protein
MNAMLTPSQIRALSELADSQLDRLMTASPAKTGKHAAPFSKTEDGRKRRHARRQAIARKRSFLD